MNVQPSYDRLWQTRLDALQAVWPEFLAGSADALHKTRVASRRLREALPVVGAATGGDKVKRLRRRLRDLTRRLGPVRELDVEIRMLEEDAKGSRLGPFALELLRREKAARRRAWRHRVKGKKALGHLEGLTKKLTRLAGDASKEQRAKSKEPRGKNQAKKDAVLATKLARRARHLKDAIDDAGALYAPERLHAVRIAAKKLRYALEIAHEIGLRGVKPLLLRLKAEQDRLGHLHDLQTLLKHVREAEGAIGADSDLSDLTTYADTIERKCRQSHAEFVEHRDVLRRCAVEVKQVLVPALVAAHAQPVSARVSRGRASTRKTA